MVTRAPAGLDAFFEVTNQGLMTAASGLAILEHLACETPGARLLLWIVELVGERVVGLDLGPAVEEYTIARDAVAPGSSNFLIVALE